MSGVTLQNIRQLRVQDSIFKNLVSTSDVATGSAGALTLSQSVKNKATSNSFFFTNVTFESCSGPRGGALSLQDIENVKVSQSLFQRNQAETMGGAINFFCQNYKRDLNKCSLDIDKTRFVQNTAGIEGGAIKWNFYEPVMDLSTITFSSNKAGVYGNDIAAVA
jgi:hypothetical protein